jgi:AcrR family transcriptional regulator
MRERTAKPAGVSAARADAIRPAASVDAEWRQFLADIIARCQRANGERKQDRSKKRDSEILRAALRVFARDGISRSRIGDIAAEAGMPLSTIYEYYASKEEIAYTVPLATFAQFFREYADAVVGLYSARDRLRNYLWLAADFARRNPEWARVLYLEIWPSMLVAGSPLRDSFDDYVRIVLHLIRQGEVDGEWPEGPNRYETAAILHGSVNQIIITALLYRRPRNLSAAAHSIVDRAMAVLQPTAVKKRVVAKKPIAKATR